MLAAFLTMILSRVDTSYTEPLRPQFHFTAKAGWINDPNGLVYYDGEYHLFFQHNPSDTKWGNMTWGHAVSKDLLHWKQLDDAIAPDAMGTIFSGSAVVDEHNTSGLDVHRKPPMVCFYTAAGGTSDASKGKPFTQCMAYSSDGRKFTKWSGNPVLSHIEGTNRDPKVIWYEPGKCWVMALFLDGDNYCLLTSPDLKKWTRTDDVEIPGSGECPDLFELPVDGDWQNPRWVFWSANGSYKLGEFDGKKYVSLTRPIPTDFGDTGYAAQTFFNDPKGRRVQISWLNNSNFPNVAWNQQLGIPTELSLHTTADGPRLAIYPVEEVSHLRDGKLRESRGEGHTYKSKTGLIDLDAEFETADLGQLELTINGTEIEFDQDTRTLKVLGKSATLPPGHTFKIRALADRASLEIYADGGLVTMPFFVLQTGGTKGVSWKLDNAKGWKVKKFDAYGMSSVWHAK
jgi:fructan beta-fructosidase